MTVSVCACVPDPVCVPVCVCVCDEVCVCDSVDTGVVALTLLVWLGVRDDVLD